MNQQRKKNMIFYSKELKIVTIKEPKESSRSIGSGNRIKSNQPREKSTSDLRKPNPSKSKTYYWRRRRVELKEDCQLAIFEAYQQQIKYPFKSARSSLIKSIDISGHRSKLIERSEVKENNLTETLEKEFKVLVRLRVSSKGSKDQGFKLEQRRRSVSSRLSKLSKIYIAFYTEKSALEFKKCMDLIHLLSKVKTKSRAFEILDLTHFYKSWIEKTCKKSQKELQDAKPEEEYSSTQSDLEESKEPTISPDQLTGDQKYSPYFKLDRKLLENSQSVIIVKEFLTKAGPHMNSILIQDLEVSISQLATLKLMLTSITPNQLLRLKFSNCGITESSLIDIHKELTRNKRLEVLSFDYCRRLTDESFALFEELWERLGRIKSFSLRGSPHITGEINFASFLSSCCKKLSLEVLDLSRNSLGSDVSYNLVENLFSKWELIQSLRLIDLSFNRFTPRENWLLGRMFKKSGLSRFCDLRVRPQPLSNEVVFDLVEHGPESLLHQKMRKKKLKGRLETQNSKKRLKEENEAEIEVLDSESAHNRLEYGRRKSNHVFVDLDSLRNASITQESGREEEEQETPKIFPIDLKPINGSSQEQSNAADSEDQPQSGSELPGVKEYLESAYAGLETINTPKHSSEAQELEYYNTETTTERKDRLVEMFVIRLNRLLDFKTVQKNMNPELDKLVREAILMDLRGPAIDILMLLKHKRDIITNQILELSSTVLDTADIQASIRYSLDPLTIYHSKQDMLENVQITPHTNLTVDQLLSLHPLICDYEAVSLIQTDAMKQLIPELEAGIDSFDGSNQEMVLGLKRAKFMLSEPGTAQFYGLREDYRLCISRLLFLYRHLQYNDSDNLLLLKELKIKEMREKGESLCEELLPEWWLVIQERRRRPDSEFIQTLSSLVDLRRFFGRSSNQDEDEENEVEGRALYRECLTSICSTLVQLIKRLLDLDLEDSRDQRIMTDLIWKLILLSRGEPNETADQNPLEEAIWMLIPRQFLQTEIFLQMANQAFQLIFEIKEDQAENAPSSARQNKPKKLQNCFNIMLIYASFVKMNLKHHLKFEKLIFAILHILESRLLNELNSMDKDSLDGLVKSKCQNQLKKVIMKIVEKLVYTSRFVENASKFEARRQRGGIREHESGSNSSRGSRKAKSNYLPKKSSILEVFQRNNFFSELRITIRIPYTQKPVQIFRAKNTTKVEEFLKKEVLPEQEEFAEYQSHYWLILEIDRVADIPLDWNWSLSLVKHLLSFLEAEFSPKRVRIALKRRVWNNRIEMMSNFNGYMQERPPSDFNLSDFELEAIFLEAKWLFYKTNYLKHHLNMREILQISTSFDIIATRGDIAGASEIVLPPCLKGLISYSEFTQKCEFYANRSQRGKLSEYSNMQLKRIVIEAILSKGPFLCSRAYAYRLKGGDSCLGLSKKGSVFINASGLFFTNTEDPGSKLIHFQLNELFNIQISDLDLKLGFVKEQSRQLWIILDSRMKQSLVCDIISYCLVNLRLMTKKFCALRALDCAFDYSEMKMGNRYSAGFLQSLLEEIEIYSNLDDPIENLYAFSGNFQGYWVYGDAGEIIQYKKETQNSEEDGSSGMKALLESGLASSRDYQSGESQGYAQPVPRSNIIMKRNSILNSIPDFSDQQMNKSESKKAGIIATNQRKSLFAKPDKQTKEVSGVAGTAEGKMNQNIFSALSSFPGKKKKKKEESQKEGGKGGDGGEMSQTEAKMNKNIFSALSSFPGKKKKNVDENGGNGVDKGFKRQMTETEKRLSVNLAAALSTFPGKK